MAYRFGPFLYDPVSHGLLHEGMEIPLTHKSRELLLLFLLLVRQSRCLLGDDGADPKLPYSE
jgi:DNA-binding winged helix-turn-helix (wHTH) protein